MIAIANWFYIIIGTAGQGGPSYTMYACNGTENSLAECEIGSSLPEMCRMVGTVHCFTRKNR